MALILDLLARDVRMSISIPLSVMYGYDIESLDDPFVATTTRIFSFGITRMLNPNGSWINIAPWLAKIPEWVPWTNSQSMIKEVARLNSFLRKGPLEAAKQRVVSSCFVSPLVHFRLTISGPDS
jgi:hypothetical protein